MIPIRYLLLTYGNESSLEIAQSLLKHNDAVIYGCHYDNNNAGRVYLNDKYIFNVPNPFKPNADIEDFIKKLDTIVSENYIDIALITNCKILKVLLDNRDIVNRYSNLLNALLEYRFNTDDNYNEEFCIDKLALHKKFPEITAKTYDKNSLLTLHVDTTIVFKKRFGTSGDGILITTVGDFLSNLSDKTKYLDETQYIICEYLPNSEVTVDVFSIIDPSHHLCHIQEFSVRHRLATREGISTISQIANLDIHKSIANILNNIIGKTLLTGLWFAQFKQDKDGVWKLLEINHRVSGSIATNKLIGKDLVSLYHKYNTDWKKQYPNVNAIVKDNSKQTLYRHFNALEKDVKQYVVDLDGTLVTETHGQYNLAEPIIDNINKINSLFNSGARIIIHSARGMKRYNNDIAEVNKQYYQFTINQLKKFGILYTTLILGKPWGIPVDEDAKTIGSL